MAILTGTLGNDEVGGTLQSDLILALAGDDFVTGADGADTIDGGSGNDALYASTQSNYDDGVMDIINGGAGNDVIYGAVGDSLDGGTGRDTLYLNLASASEGVEADFREMTIGVDLGLGGLVRLELPLLTGTLGNFEVVAEVRGSAFADELFIANVGGVGTKVDAGGGDDFVRSSGGSDVLIGGAGNDRLSASGGRDVMDGGAGDDTLIAGGSLDVVTGGNGADRFIFEVDHSGAGRNTADRITDFSQAEGDRIHLGSIDHVPGTPENERLTFLGDARFTGTAGELRFNQLNGNTFVSADLDGDGQSDFVLQLDGLVTLTAADFQL